MFQLHKYFLIESVFYPFWLQTPRGISLIKLAFNKLFINSALMMTLILHTLFTVSFAFFWQHSDLLRWLKEFHKLFLTLPISTNFLGQRSYQLYSAQLVHLRQGLHSVREVKEIRDFFEKVREENFYPCNFLTSIKQSFARRYMCSWNA